MAVNALNKPLLIPAGLFRCPRCGTSAAIPTAQLVSNGITPQGALPVGRCCRCEHQYAFTLGGPSTTLSGAHAQGLASLAVAAGAAFSTVGAWLVIDGANASSGAEVLQVSSAGSSGAIPVTGTPLRLAHNSGDTVQSATLGPLGPMT